MSEQNTLPDNPKTELTPLVTRAVSATPAPQPTDTSPPRAPPPAMSKASRPVVTSITPVQVLGKAETNATWGSPVGLPVRGCNDENLIIFRRAVGINFHKPTSDDCTLEAGRKEAIGIYKSIIREQTIKSWQHIIIRLLLNACHFAQIVIGAALTALGPTAAKFPLTITILGATNTIIAGVLALVKGQGLPERLRKDEVEFRKVQDWVEETEALLAVGIVGKDRREVGYLVEVAFRKYNAAKASSENNRPDMYVPQRDDDEEEERESNKGSAMVRLNVKPRFGREQV